jgi:hypothetical protein
MLEDPVMRAWHERLLKYVRSRKCGGFDKQHFKTRTRERGISDAEIEFLRYQGKLVAIEIGSDDPDLEWMPKYIFRISFGHNRLIEGVFATDGIRLRGITCYPVDQPIAQ